MDARIYRALNERIYLLKAEQTGSSGSSDPSQWSFEVKGQSNKVYKTNFVKNGPCKCNCMDFCLRKKFCKHLIFITERIAKQTSVTHCMLGNNHLSTDNFTLLNSSLRQRLSNQSQPDQVQTKAESKPVDTGRKLSETNEDCFICFESLEGETLVQCITTCKNYFHEECLKIWLSRSKSCPLCRADWIDPTTDRPKPPNGVDDALDFLEQTTLKPVIKLRLIPWSDEIIG